MKKNKLSLNIFSIALLFPYLVLANAGTAPTLSDFSGQVTTGAQTILAIVNQILIVIIFAGLIYVVGSLIGSGSPKKEVVAAWIASIIIWGLAQLFLGVDNSTTG